MLADGNSVILYLMMGCYIIIERRMKWIVVAKDQSNYQFVMLQVCYFKLLKHIVHTTDNRRFDLILGEQRYYLRALSKSDRQRWIVALGSCKAGNDIKDNRDFTYKGMIIFCAKLKYLFSNFF